MGLEHTQDQAIHMLRVRNFGKLSRADIRFGNFTVLAGPNNTGKSFVSKLLYSIFNALNADLERERVFRLIWSLGIDAKRFARERRSPLPLWSIVSEIGTVALSYARADNPDIDQVTSSLLALADKWRRELSEPMPAAAAIEDDDDRRQQSAFELANLRRAVDHLLEELKRAGNDRAAFIEDELKYRLMRNLSGNFQVPNIRHLRGDPNDNLTVNVDDVLHIDLAQNTLSLKLNSAALGGLSDASNVVYLESPIYWKIFAALRDSRRSLISRRRARRTALTGVPDYFHDLAESLGYEYTEEMAYPEIHRRLIDIVGGRVSVSEFGEMSFEEAGRSYPLSNAANGVANIGVLAMLIERKIIDHGTMLFIDEPEAHLHTAWQAIVAEALFRLAKEGVTVVIATHSADILKWLEVHLKEYPNDAQFVALNRFPGPSSEDEDLETQLARIKQDLTRSFFDLYMRGM